MHATDTLLFSPIPKCATHTIIAVLERELGAVRLPGDTHRPPTVEELRGRTLVFATRNPLDWYVSLWHHAMRGERTRRFLAQWVGEFFTAEHVLDQHMWQFIARASLGAPAGPVEEPGILFNGMPWYGDGDPLHGLVRDHLLGVGLALCSGARCLQVEHLEHDLCQLIGREVDVPHLNRRKR